MAAPYHPYYHAASVVPKEIEMDGTNAVAAQEAPAEHAHHWLIEEANGQRSRGVCKHCGAVKDFKNWLEDSDFITNEEHRVAA